MAKQFTLEEWKKINEHFEKDPYKYGLPKRIYGSVVLGSFNIRKLGAETNRSQETWKFLAKVCSYFDLLAVQEIQDNLSGLRCIMEFLGPDFALIISDITGAFPSGKGLAERLGFIFNLRLVERTEIATDITYDRTEVLNALAVNRDSIFPVIKRYGEYLDDVKAWEEAGKPDPKPKEPSASQKRLPVFLTFIRQPFCVGFKINGLTGTTPYEFMTVNAHLNYGDPKHDPKQEFHALMDWIVARAGQKETLYHPNFILMGDLNMDFDDPVKDKEKLIEEIKSLNTVTREGVTVNFPFIDKHPDCADVFRTNVRESETYDQIGIFFRDKRLPSFEINETEMGKNPTGPDYGVFNYTDLFADALGIADADRNTLIGKFEHSVSDHHPIWLRLPLPE